MNQKIENEKLWLQSVVVPKIFNSNDLQILQIDIKIIGPEEAFMLTNCYHAIIEYELNGQRRNQQLVVKKTPQVPEDIYDGINFGALFNNEILAYTKLVPAFEQFTKRTFKIPKYFYSDQQRYSAAIVLEHFGASGWRVPKDRYNLSLEHVLIAVKYLGDFHGIGFAMRELKRADFYSITGQLKESRYTSDLSDDLTITLNEAIGRLLKTTRQYQSHVDEQFLGKLEKLLKDGYKYGKQRVLPIEPFITLCHGDFLRNNIAFQYAVQQNGLEVPTEVMMFDLQTMRASSPMVDLGLLLLLSTFAEVRSKNFKLIFDTYREQLIKTYEKHTEKSAPAFFSYDALLKEYIRYMPYNTHIAAYFLMTLVDPPQESPDDFLTAQRTREEIVDDLMTRGGEIVDRELSHQVKELYELSREYGVDIAEGIHLDE